MLVEEVDLEKLTKNVLNEVVQWYNAEKSTQTRVCIGIAIAEVLHSHYPIEEEHWLTERGQVRTSGQLIAEILLRFGEQRTYSREGGRTTRSAPTDARELVEILNQPTLRSDLERISAAQRKKIAQAIQMRMYEEVRDFFNRQKIRIDLDMNKPFTRVVGDILAAAEERGGGGVVAQHLIGAKLALRFPDIEIENHASTTADAQLGRPGDFLIGDSAFHVTMAPGVGVVKRCTNNLSQGYKPILVVPHKRHEGARQLIETEKLLDCVNIFSLEHFIGQNLDELSGFRQSEAPIQLRLLLEKYNERLEEVETDLSLQVEIPRNL